MRTSKLLPYPRTVPSLGAKPACTCTPTEKCSTCLQEQQITEVPQLLPVMCSSKSITSAKLRFTSQCSTEHSKQALGSSTLSPKWNPVKCEELISFCTFEMTQQTPTSERCLKTHVVGDIFILRLPTWNQLKPTPQRNYRNNSTEFPCKTQIKNSKAQNASVLSYIEKGCKPAVKSKGFFKQVATKLKGMFSVKSCWFKCFYHIPIIPTACIYAPCY